MFGLKKKINENEKIKKFKEIWSNKKYRSLIMLGMYFIFFIALGIMFRTSSSNVSEDTKQVHDINQVLSNFETNLKDDYKYTVSINNTSLLTGAVTNGTNSFSYQNEEYLIINNNLYHNESDNLVLMENFLNTSISIQYLTLGNIISNIKDLEPIYDKESGNGYETKYEVSLNKLVNKNEENDNIVQLKLTSVDEKIKEIKIIYQFDNYIIKLIEE